MSAWVGRRRSIRQLGKQVSPGLRGSPTGKFRCGPRGGPLNPGRPPAAMAGPKAVEDFSGVVVRGPFRENHQEP